MMPLTFDMAKILESKRKLRQQLAARPIEEKLAMLDALRERAPILGQARPVLKKNALRATSPPYTAQKKKSD